MVEKVSHRSLTEEQKNILKQALWDLNLTPEEFLAIIEGTSDRKWPDRGFCVARLLESVNWFDIVKIIEPIKIYALWENAKKYVRADSIKEGMDFASRILQKNYLPSPG
ncbi:MAG TPA: hypothetical protein DDW17_01385 [Deltaproteobacteria bacterium]|nr:hypothetical protein [Deltaproteobacteria bacterium]